MWRDFTASVATTSEAPGVRAAWHKGRPRYAVWVIRVQNEAVQERVNALAHKLAPWLTPELDLHVTLAIAGFPRDPCFEDDDVSVPRLYSQATEVSKRARTVLFRVEGACSFSAAPFLSVDDSEGHLHELRAVLDPPGRALSMNAYLPHVTVGRWNGAHATAPLARLIEPFINAPPLAVTANAVELVEYDAADPNARLITRIRVPLL